MSAAPPAEAWTYKDIAKFTGVAVGTVRAYNNHRSTGRSAGMPEPAGSFNGAPYWNPEDIQRWHENRKGSGFWGNPGSRANKHKSE